MAIKDWPVQERPREKLLFNGGHILSDAELLAILFRTGLKGKTALDLAKEAISHFGGLRRLLEATKEQFCSIPGLNLNKYCVLQAVLELGQRYLKESLHNVPLFDNSLLSKNYLISKLRHYRHEVFACLFLDTRNQFIAYEELFHGSIESALVYPRKVVLKALEYHASSLIFAHNHPSGMTTPSEQDKITTSQLRQTLEPLEIQVLDHIIIGEGKPFSFAEEGLL